MKELEEAKKLIGEIPIKDIGSINILILSKAIEKINEYQERVKNLALPHVSNCTCGVEVTTGWTEVKCCNICGKPIEGEVW